MNGLTSIPATEEAKQRALQNARKMGVSVSTYVTRLIINDTKPERKKLVIRTVEEDYGGPIPKKLRDMWDKEANEAEEEVRQGKRKAYSSVEELIAALNA